MKTKKQKFIVCDYYGKPMSFDTDQFYYVESVSNRSKRKKFKIELECYDMDEINNLISVHDKFRRKNNFSYQPIRIIPFHESNRALPSVESYNKAIETMVSNLTFDENEEVTVSKHFFMNRILK